MEEAKICEPGSRGFLLPFTDGEQYWPAWLRAVLYTAGLVYLFLGINIVADKFVSSIEKITSKKRRVLQRSTGRIITVEVWNGTVSNLTLMALGSSAPEILLSIVEVTLAGFHSGELGPSTIVGSAAFNLFMIIAVCIMAVPSPEMRRIKEYDVFVVTAIFSLFAYVWLVFIVQVSSPDVIEIWEGLVTLAFFPILIVVSYLADVGWWRRDRRSPSAPLPSSAALEAGDPAGADVLARDARGAPLENSAGVIAFSSDTFEVACGLNRRELSVPVFRRNCVRGAVSCRYRMEGRTAVPGYDYVAREGELIFAPGACRAEVPIELLPKRLGEHSDQFQIILEDAEGGAIFNPCSDGGEQRNVLTVTILNENDTLTSYSASMRVSRFCDGVCNMDSFRLALADWHEEVVASVCQVGDGEGQSPSLVDKVMHAICLPWKLAFAVMVPPTALAGGWLCFTFSLIIIGGITIIVIDFAELFGCVTGIEDSITAITFVALGTSMPDLFASMSAAAQDETADASIVNVTGSNSVNVFLGIGLPWTMAAIYWAVVGPTDTWKAKYGSYLGDYPGGAFIVPSGDLAFSVIVFSIAALVALGAIRLRRARVGAELGGPFGTKVLSSSLLVLLWVFYITLSIWKVVTGPTDLGSQAVAIFLAFCVLENVMLACGLCLYFLQDRQAPVKRADLENGAASIYGLQQNDCFALPLPPQTKEADDVTHGASVILGVKPMQQSHALRHAGLVSGCVRHQLPLTSEAEMLGVARRKANEASISFASAAMVCLAAQRFRRGAFNRPQPPWETLSGEGSAFRRVPSFYSIDDSTSSGGYRPGGTSTAPAATSARSMGDAVAGWMGDHAADVVALSVAGIAGMQLARH